MLTTACTYCKTAFQVTAEQLKAREGRVRCGKCHAIFNALSALKVLEDREDAAAVSQNAEVASRHAADSAAAPGGWHEPPGESSISPLRIQSGDSLAPDKDLTPQFAKFDSAPKQEAAQTAALPAQLPGDAAAPFAEPASNIATPTPAAPPVQESLAPSPHEAKPTFDFGPPPVPRRAWWWSPFAMLLFLGLLAQSGYYFRGAIAFMVPELKPYINELCAELECEVPLPRRAELISIETSDLQADPTNPGVIVLLATLRNRAAFPQTFPALELTLTNERDQALARRVLQASDYLADKTEVFEGSSEKQVRLNLEAGSLKASGYRLYLFYP
ncbi:MAG: DUF3426 domain-containing protein [Burkholderiales bacterium]